MTRVIESDVCIIGSGITAAMVAEKLSEERDAHIVVVEAGNDNPPLPERFGHRRRYLDYGESPWLNDHLDDYSAPGMQSRSMQVGGLAMHWGGVTPRFSPEDFKVRSIYGVGDDWPLSYEGLDPFYQEAEERIGVAGEQGPTSLDPRSAPFPMPALPLSYNLELLRAWGARAGIAFWSQPSAKNSIPYRNRSVCCRSDTCFPVCPVGAKYTPDFTWNALRDAGKIELVTRTIVRRLIPKDSSSEIERAIAVDRDAPDDPVEFRAKTFVVAAGYVWSSHLLLLSRSPRFPNGIANRSGLVGKFVTGHRHVAAYVRLPQRLYPGLNTQHSLVTKQFMRPRPRPGSDDRYLRHDLRIWESTFASTPRLTDDGGTVMLGDEIFDDWQHRTQHGVARVRAYYDVLPHKESALTLDPSRRNRWGDPMPRLSFRDSDASRALRGFSEEQIGARFSDMARAGDGEILTVQPSNFQDHPAGGCRMGEDPEASVCDSFGQTHDHENLFVVGAPTCVTGGCANGTLTFIALGLRAASGIAKHFPLRRVTDEDSASHHVFHVDRWRGVRRKRTGPAGY